MTIRMGTSLSALSMDMFRPKAKTGTEQGIQNRILSESEIQIRQKQLEAEKVNAGKKKSSDSDDFFLKFTEHRLAGASSNPIKMAKMMQDSKENHMISTNCDAAASEQKRISENFADKTQSHMEVETKNDGPLTDKEIAILKQNYDISHMKEDDAAKLLGELADIGLIEEQWEQAALSVYQDDEQGIDLYKAHQEMASYLEKLAAGKEEGRVIHVSGRPIEAMEMRERAMAHKEIAQVLKRVYQQGDSA